MNRLVIIGNGFDLAHGLKTTYEDFINDYLSTIFFCAQKSNMSDYKDDLIKISNIPENYTGFNKADFITSIQKGIQNQNQLLPRSFTALNFNYDGFQFTIKSEFFGNILLKSADNWVDFECLYYDFLLEIHQKKYPHDGHINQLNNHFSIIQKELELYLNSNKLVDTSSFSEFSWAIKGLLECESFQNPDITSNQNRLNGSLCVLNFNYTNTVDQYLKALHVDPSLINIHGELNNPENPVIFGYGDYHHEEYSKLENANRKGLMINMKAMHYPKTYNRQRLLRFLDSGKTGMTKRVQGSAFEVLILGHSCGLSDRNLLRTIFEHPNCNKIHIAFHEDSNDHFIKTIEISRHFQKKEVMLNKIEPFNEKLKIPQLIDFKS